MKMNTVRMSMESDLTVTNNNYRYDTIPGNYNNTQRYDARRTSIRKSGIKMTGDHVHRTNRNKSKQQNFKILILCGMCLIILACFIIGGILSRTENCMAGNNEEKYFTYIVIEEGDTLWEIAWEYMDTEHYSSVYEYMNELRRMNSMKSDRLYAGQNFIITYYSASETE